MTLIEILVVMAIMTIIAGTIVVAMVGVIGHTQGKATQAFFETIKAQLALHRDQDKDREYPHGSDDLWEVLEYEGTFAAKRDFVEPDGTFTDPVTNAIVPHYKYVDAWKKDIQYTCDPPYRRFELRSGGKDLEMNTDDDIVSTD